MSTTNIYHKERLIRQEKLCNLREFIQMGRLKPGQCIFIGDVIAKKNGEIHTNTETIWIGDATPYHKPSTNDGGFGWDFEDFIMDKFVLEVYEYRS